jgi:putative transposase
MPLPRASPERNAQKHFRQHFRQAQLCNRIFAGNTAIPDACQHAWRALLAETGRIASIATRSQACIGQSH